MLRRFLWWLDEPVHLLRIEIARVGVPIAILGFLAGRIVHADEWIGDAGFRVPDLGGDWRQPLYVPALPSWLAFGVASAIVLAAVACALGYRTRQSALALAALLVFVTLSDRLEAYTVTKMGPAIMVAIACSSAGRHAGVDAWRARHDKPRPEPVAPSGSVRFLQLLVVVMYSASGIAKARGDWLKVPLVLWSHVHDSYQTAVSFAIASTLPAWVWTVLQGAVLVFEVFAPLWLGMARTRPWALVFGLGMHTMIGLMFGPVRWLALLMMTLLVAGYLPDGLVEQLDARIDRVWLRA
jgi:uncharacterized membrane protein YphA (DoxX/SURF4 family)